MAERRVEIRVSVDDLEANARLDALAVKLDRLKMKFGALGKMVISPKIDLSGITKANTEIDRLNAKLDDLGRKDVTANVKVKFDENAFRRAIDASHRAEASAFATLSSSLGASQRARRTETDFARFMFEGSGGKFGDQKSFNWGSLLGAGGWGALIGRSGGGAGGGGGGFANFAMSPTGAGIIAALLGPASALIDALIGQGIGSGVGAGAFAGAAHYDPRQTTGVLSGITGPNGVLSNVFQSVAPSIGMMLAQLDKFAKSPGISTMLAKLFGASLPFIQQFIHLGKQAAVTILPALTQAMQTMASSGALKQMSQGFVFIIQGIAQFIKDIGPGMKAGAETFRAISLGIKGVLDFLGTAFGQLGKETGIVYHDIHDWWDKLRHNTAVIFDGIRHETAHVWDMIYQDTIAKVVETYHDVVSWEQHMRHDISNDFDLLRHYIASEWDQIWSNTIGRVERGVSDVETWFHKLPTGVQNALRGLGMILEGIAKLSLSLFWSGFKSVGSSILGWFKGFGGSILHALKSVFGIASPSRAMYDIGRNLGLGLEHGLQSRYAPIKATVGQLGGSVTSWIIAALHGAGKPMSWLPALTRLVSLESGGNPRAVNPISVLGQHASGLWQMLPSTFAAYGGRGSLFNPITEGIAALRYIAADYGSPFNIPGLFSGNYRGYAAGGVISEPIFGLGLRTGMNYTFGERGIHERVTPLGAGGGGGGDIYNIYPPESATDPNAYGKSLVVAIRKYKMLHGNAVLGIA